MHAPAQAHAPGPARVGREMPMGRCQQGGRCHAFDERRLGAWSDDEQDLTGHGDKVEVAVEVKGPRSDSIQWSSPSFQWSSPSFEWSEEPCDVRPRALRGRPRPRPRPRPQRVKCHAPHQARSTVRRTQRKQLHRARRSPDAARRSKRRSPPPPRATLTRNPRLASAIGTVWLRGTSPGAHRRAVGPGR